MVKEIYIYIHTYFFYINIKNNKMDFMKIKTFCSFEMLLHNKPQTGGKYL